ncbi:tryptophan 2,3-dioxygenase [Virgisporangium aliadipatigenens]|uniref:Tryptophan 2,3-dioxygenase n=1 Tax=Virgisporangium aliadipatigenens TaxID=741659 RepID=A0A8J3YV15_9ACTN|nr:tryptophan 2,3-dioxygenase family protein [Virgisporangium aliadipatigenens]GIJ51033.1 tryptophan 2,3-dioxygenase [Virgisporangium aliadipatigenens]
MSRDHIIDVAEPAVTGSAVRPRGGGGLTYGSYLRLADLLALQVPESDPVAHDELLFITIHQVYELWFKVMLSELVDARDRMLAGETYVPRVRLQRCHVIERTLVQQVDVIDTMAPQDFAEFRGDLGAASGFQSSQFREIEFISGLKDPDYTRRFRGIPQEEARLRRRLAEPTLWDGFVSLLDKAGFEVCTAEERFSAYKLISADRERYSALWDLAEALLEHDQAWALWRGRHVLMVERQIGTKPGTGGSSGTSYLRSRADLQFYPELWQLRTRI